MPTVLLLVIALLLVSGIALLWVLEERHRAQIERLVRRPADAGRGEQLLEYTECVLASITSGVLVVDTLARVTVMNREAESIFGCSPRELIGRSLHRLYALKPLIRLINQVRSIHPPSHRSGRQYEIDVARGSGRQLGLGVSVNALTGAGGRVLGYVIVFRDLTETRAIIADLDRSRKLSALGAMASGAAHNFSNTLATILGRVQLLLRYPPTYEKLVEGIKIVEKCALDGVATVKRISDFARRGPSIESFTSVDIAEIVCDVVTFTRTRWDEQAREKGLTYDVQTDLVRVPPVRGSSSELREVLINLILNAIDAMPGGGSIRIGARGDGSTVRIWVADTGPGIPEEHLVRLFEPFFTTKGKRGTGLGLFESYNMVERHRGRLSCQSEVGRGTTFTIELPAAAPGGGPVPPAFFERRG